MECDLVVMNLTTDGNRAFLLPIPKRPHYLDSNLPSKDFEVWMKR